MTDTVSTTAPRPAPCTCAARRQLAGVPGADVDALAPPCPHHRDAAGGWPDAPAQAARAWQCPLCGAPPGAPCQRKPEGDHLARYLDAYTAGQLTRAYMAAVLAELVVVTRWRIVPGGAR